MSEISNGSNSIELRGSQERMSNTEFRRIYAEVMALCDAFNQGVNTQNGEEVLNARVKLLRDLAMTIGVATQEVTTWPDELKGFPNEPYQNAGNIILGGTGEPRSFTLINFSGPVTDTTNIVLPNVHGFMRYGAESSDGVNPAHFGQSNDSTNHELARTVLGVRNSVVLQQD
jgi:hypothetical protein